MRKDNTTTASPIRTADALAKWVPVFERQNLHGDVHVLLEDLTGFIRGLFTSFQVIQAAGGYVENHRGDLLMIFRRGFWDLPKGKLDAGETAAQAAVREVEEECGIDQLSIRSEPFNTYHVYTDRGKSVIKESIWYRMDTGSTIDPVPQEEEDITEARWQSVPVPEDMLNGAYRSIQEVIAHFA